MRDYMIAFGHHSLKYPPNIQHKSHLPFFYYNSALQHQSLNRGVWNRLEQFETSLANFYQVDVTIEVKFDNPVKRVAAGAAIPKEFIKTIKFGDKVITFVFPNKDTSGSDWIDYLIK